MRRRSLRELALGVLMVVGACAPFAGSDGASDGDPRPEPSDDASAESDDSGGLNTTGVGAGTGADTDLPCDVQQLLENRCIGCHLATSRLPLLTYDDLVRPAPSNPAKVMAAVAVERMQDTSNPMPPPPATAPDAEEVGILKAWVVKNEPRGEACTPLPAADAGVPPPTTNYNTPLVCTSNKLWTSGSSGKGGFGGFGGPGGGRHDDDGSPEMEPGKACLTCHSIRGGPVYQVAGTVYPTAHEPDECAGVNGGMDVEITDAKGVVTTVKVNAAGNFFTSTKIAAPFHVKVKKGAAERAMATALTAGDCNTCHTATGANGAPGRVMAP